jgi:hypothetical protein
MVGTATHWQLPEFFPPSEAYNTNLTVANEALQEQFGITQMTTRYAVRIPNSGTPLNVYVAEPLQEFPPTVGYGSRWFPIESLAELEFASADQGELLLAWLRGVGEESQNLHPWWREGWIYHTEARWQHVFGDPKKHTLESLHQIRSSYTSAVVSAGSGKEAVYLKSVAPPFHQEIAITRRLAALHPSFLPTILQAHETEMLMMHVHGESVGSHTSLATWAELAHCYAVIQSRSVSHVDSLLSDGCHDLRVTTVRQRLDLFPSRLESALKGTSAGLTEPEWDRLDFLLPHIARKLHCLETSGLPDSLEHGDLHVGNIRWISEKKHPVFLDWSHACVTFPFHGYGTLMLDDDWFAPESQTASARVEWAYLSPWAAYVGERQLAEAFVAWKPLRHLFLAERQMAIVESFQEIWRDADCGYGPRAAMRFGRCNGGYAMPSDNFSALTRIFTDGRYGEVSARVHRVRAHHRAEVARREPLSEPRRITRGEHGK